MKLKDLIDFLNDTDLLDKLYQQEGLNKDSEAILIYMKDFLNIESEIILLEIEETEDNVVFVRDGIRYIQLFPLEYTIDLIEFDLDLKNKGYTNFEIAERLLEYRERDA